MKTLYQTTVTATGGRNGSIKSEDGILSLEVRIPKEMGGSPGYTNPEQLFAGGYAACFDSALGVVLHQAGIRPAAPTTVKATVGLGKTENHVYGLSVKLSVEIPGVSRTEALSLVEKAHQVCPYSNATRGNVAVELEVI
jgi:osmotically inducible protein OsmC